MLAPVASFLAQHRPRHIHTSLLYHGVLAPGDPTPLNTGVHVTSQAIADCLDTLLQLDAIPITIDEIAQRISRAESLPPFSVSITFDDAYANVVANALPLLEARGFKATVFAPAGLIDTDQLLWSDQVFALADHRPDVIARASSELQTGTLGSTREVVRALKLVPDEVRQSIIHRLEDWSGLPDYPSPGSSRICAAAELRELAAHGWNIGSHGMTHAMLTRLSDAQSRRELRESRERIEALTGETPAGFAYPDGAFTQEHTRMVAEAGYDFAVTVDNRLTDASQSQYAMSRSYPEPVRSRCICLVTGFKQRMQATLRL